MVDGREIAGVEVVATSIEPRTVDDSSTELDPVEMLPTIRAESGPQILEALRSDMTDSVGTTLKLVHSAAIIGPNTLEFVFPISYDFARRMCERPEVVMQLESRLKSLTGQALRLRFRTVAVPTAPEPEIERVPTPVGRSATATDEADPFVDAVGRIMGVERWARRELGPAATETDGQNEA